MINVYDRGTRLKTAVIGTDKDVIEESALNEVGSLTFSVPGSDPKAAKLLPFHYVRWNERGKDDTHNPLYRILAPGSVTNDVEIKTYECEHVIATLVDDVLFGSFVIGNIGVYTDEVIRWVLSKQTTQHWVLGECDFRRQFEYGWTDENLLAALFSIPNRFTEPYMWVYDTSRYPWTISLKRIDVTRAPQFYIRAGKNLISSDADTTAQEVCTRLYGRGYGEGVNQLTIASVNNGLPYIDAPQEYIDRYGLISRIFVDRRFEIAQSLKERMEALLAELREPAYRRTVTAADLFQITQAVYDKAEVGRITLLTDDGTKTYITQVRRNRDVAGDLAIDLSTKPTDIASSIADLADRQRIEAVYAQGATQIYAQSVQANATTAKGAVLKFYIPDEMRIINSVKARIVLDRFRSYSKSTTYGGSSVQTSSAGGGSQQTSSSGGGGTSTSSSGGGGTSSTTSEASNIRTTEAALHNIQGYTGETTLATDTYSTGTKNSHVHSYRFLDYDSGYGRHKHHIWVDAAHSHSMSHTHTVSVSFSAHSHSVSIPAHSHSVNIPSHSHTVNIPAHTHDLVQGIFEFGNASGAGIYVNGTLKANMSTDAEIELTTMLLDNNGNLPRGTWLDVEIRPNDLAYVCIDLFVQGFIQSRGESVY